MYINDHSIKLTSCKALTYFIKDLSKFNLSRSSPVFNKSEKFNLIQPQNVALFFASPLMPAFDRRLCSMNAATTMCLNDLGYAELVAHLADSRHVLLVLPRLQQLRCLQRKHGAR